MNGSEGSLTSCLLVLQFDALLLHPAAVNEFIPVIPFQSHSPVPCNGVPPGEGCSEHLLQKPYVNYPPKCVCIYSLFIAVSAGQ